MKNLLKMVLVHLLALLETMFVTPFKLEGGQPMAISGGITVPDRNMAKVKFSALISEMRNKLNGSVFSKNRAGNYLRNKVTPVNPQTSFQIAVRNSLTSLSQGFRSLTSAQILSWNTAVANFTGTDIFGDSKTPSGINLYVKLNLNLITAGQAQIVAPPLPAGAVPVVITGVTADFSSSLFTIASALAAVPAGHTLIIEATPLVSPGKSFVKSEFRVIGTELAAAAFPVLAGARWIAKFGTLVTGQKVFCRVKTVRNATGEASGYSQVFTIVVP